MPSRPVTDSSVRGLPQRFGRYELTSLIARGGMAEIFVATQLSEGGFCRRVVVKRILPHLGCDPEFTRMFLDEARIAMRLSHPHIAHTYDVGIQGDDHFIVLELVDGPSLRELQKRGGMPEGVALRIAADVAAALSHAHRLVDEAGCPLGIVHRDVSPHNILVGRDGSVKLIDFGIAKARSQLHDTETGSMKGKFAYMAPEQFDRSGVDPRTDLFSLSVVLWEMLAGERLFKHDSAPETMHAICSDERPLLSSVRPGTGATLERLVHRGLARRREERWSDAEQFAMALEEYIAQTGAAASSIHVGLYVRATDAAGAASPASERTERTPALVDAAGPGAVPAPPPTQSATPFAAERTLTGAAARRRGLAGLAISIGVGLLVGLIGAGLWLSIRSPTTVTARPMASAISVVPTAPALRSLVPSTGTGHAPPVAAPAPPMPDAPVSHSRPASLEPSKLAQRSSVEDSAAGGGQSDTPASRSARPPATNAKRGAVGRLYVNTRPWSRVYLRGRLLGTTPLGNVEVPTGAHRLTFELEDHSRVSRPITVGTDGPTKAFFELR